jgi:hypothetical protein
VISGFLSVLGFWGCFLFWFSPFSVQLRITSREFLPFCAIFRLRRVLQLFSVLLDWLLLGFAFLSQRFSPCLRVSVVDWFLVWLRYAVSPRLRGDVLVLAAALLRCADQYNAPKFSAKLLDLFAFGTTQFPKGWNLTI